MDRSRAEWTTFYVFGGALSAAQVLALYQQGGQLPAATPLTVNPAGTLDLNGGTDSVASLSGAGVVTNSSGAYPAVLTINDLGTSPTFSGTIVGNLSLAMAGSGVQTLAGTSSYSGSTTINGGALLYASTGALPSSGAILINQGGGIVAQGAYSTVNGWLSASPAAINTSSSGAILLTPANTDTSVNFAASPGGNYPTLSLGALGAVTYGGTIYPGSRGYYLGGGGGTLTLTTVLANTGSLQPTPLTINGPGEVLLRSTPTYTGSTTINSGGVLDLGGNTFNTTGTTVALRGGTLQDGTVVNNGSYTATSGVVTAALQGTANLTMSGPGLLVLANSNNSYGRTIVTGGVLEAMYPGALGPNYSSAGTVGVASGGTLEIPLDSTGAAGWTSTNSKTCFSRPASARWGPAHATLRWARRPATSLSRPRLRGLRRSRASAPTS